MPLRGTAGLVRPAIAALVAAMAGACATDAAGPADVSEPSVVDSLQMTSYAAATTDPRIARGNLDATIDGSRLRFERIGDVASATALVDSLHLRASMHGSVGDLVEALMIADEAVVRARRTGDAHLLRAHALAALHRFDEAHAALVAATNTGADVGHAAEAIRVAQGDHHAALRSRIDRANAYPSFASLADLAPVLIADGRFTEADAALVDALEHYRDVSPYTVAWTQFQRGVLWGEAVGDDVAAEALYRDAIRLVPDYVTAHVHLAEIEASTSRLDDALDRLRALRTVDDPEPTARLAEFLAEVNPSAAAAETADAHVRWDALVAVEPFAFADHAAEFYLGAGDAPERALELAQLNLANRTIDRAYELAIDAALAVGDDQLACRYLAEAGEERVRIGLVEARAELRCDGSR